VSLYETAQRETGLTPWALAGRGYQGQRTLLPEGRLANGAFGTPQPVMAAREELCKGVMAGSMDGKDDEGAAKSEKEVPVC
jgi:hypothetical protein